MSAVDIPIRRSTSRIYFFRHAFIVRVTHWVNALCFFVLLMSGLQIFNAHPALYWGSQSDFDRPALALEARTAKDGKLTGVTRVFGAEIGTTGLLGASRGADGELEERGFPAWITLPSYRDLAAGRRWHFFFAWVFVLNGVAYLSYSLVSKHLWRDLVPSRAQLRTLRQTFIEHLHLRFAHGRESQHYNGIQKLTYLFVVVVLLPLAVLTGLTMSPGMNAAIPFLPDLFGGRQSARTIHFIAASGLVLFFLVHLVMVLISGVGNNVRSMITGRYVVDIEGTENAG